MLLLDCYYSRAFISATAKTEEELFRKHLCPNLKSPIFLPLLYSAVDISGASPVSIDRASSKLPQLFTIITQKQRQKFKKSKRGLRAFGKLSEAIFNLIRTSHIGTTSQFLELCLQCEDAIAFFQEEQILDC